MKKQFKRLIVTSLILIYLVIAAGAVVRMTGSGMGCPDWPKCFGYLIPPTERNQLEWKANHKYNEGEVIIVNESLRVASTDFTSSARTKLKIGKLTPNMTMPFLILHTLGLNSSTVYWVLWQDWQLYYYL